MRVLYQLPSLQSIYAGRTIHNGYRNALRELGHEVRLLTADDDFKETVKAFRPDLFITASHFYYRRFVDNAFLNECRANGLFVLVWLDPWRTGLSAARINESGGIEQNREVRGLIERDKLGDAYLLGIEHGDERMEGFERETGAAYHTVPLAADHTLIYPETSEAYRADVSFIGTYLPQKREFFRSRVFPLGHKYRLRLYGQDWTLLSRAKGWAQKAGQLFNIPGLRSLQKPSLALEDERRIYASSHVSINIHEDYQRRYGGDCNERTFKIPLAGGLEVTDDVACIRKYFKPDEMVIAANTSDWFEKIDYYVRNPDRRAAIIEAGGRRVLAEHTYVHRVRQLLEIHAAARDPSRIRRTPP
jgi:spore maturation protein CgeB